MAQVSMSAEVLGESECGWMFLPVSCARALRIRHALLVSHTAMLLPPLPSGPPWNPVWAVAIKRNRLPKAEREGGRVRGR
eukprot:765566-Hanusia_phi.AAC.3